MAEEFHKPTLFSGSRFDEYEGAPDPAQVMRAAHETAHSLVDHARGSADQGVVERLVAYTDENGIEAIAELWARSSPRSLPGALWRIYLIRLLIRQDSDSTSLFFRRGAEELITIDTAVAGATMPTGPEEIIDLADQILRGLFTGDFAVALERAAAFCRILSAGCASLADVADVAHPERGTELTARAARFTIIAGELTTCARLYRAGSLD